ncbi:MAG: hypothetical protein C4524_08690 [Candidatus Zixiibacteriota bacterium]|nr:MAG: hypothetical protein C4524_08690 [candidate division Zixibacteria bacterium]
MPQQIRYDYTDGVARIVLANPPHNAMTTTMLREIHEHLDPFRDDPDLKLVVISADGEDFSAGLHPQELQPGTVVEVLTEFNTVAERLQQLMVPSLALVQGAAFGGGCELALFCDLVLAEDSARFGVTEVQIGLFAPTAAIILPQLIGRNRALEMLLTGDVITAEEATRRGLINRVVPAQRFHAEADRLIARIASHSAAALRFNHRAVDEVRLMPFEKAIRHLEDMFLNQAMISEDAREGLEAHVTGRLPRWKNR